MPQTVNQIMTTKLVQVPAGATVRQAAQRMRDEDVGDVIVEKGGKLFGILTDRDIVVRVLGQGLDPEVINVEDACSRDVVFASPEADVDDVTRTMRERAVRRIPVVDSRGETVGIISLGDLAAVRDARSVLGEISAAQPNR